MKKKGFTLVELLAVIAILAILVILALPNVIEMFNRAKKELFLTEAKNVYREVAKKYTTESMRGNNATTISNDTNSLQLSTSSLVYIAKLTNKGKINHFQVSNGEFCISGKFDSTNELTIDKITDGECEKINDNPIDVPTPDPVYCTFDGELKQGAEYVNGQYTYRYMQEGFEIGDSDGNEWGNIPDLYDGWGVQLTDKTSTDPVTSKLCTYINDKPVVSMSHMFQYSNAVTIDLNDFNTDEVTNMFAMFSNSKVVTLDLSNFNTSKVKDMGWMFYGTNIATLDLSSFDTSNVEYMHEMFAYSKVETIKELEKFNTSKVLWMRGMFLNTKVTTLDLSNFDTSNVTDMSKMFANSNTTSIKGLNNFNTSKVKNMSLMFSGTNIATLDLSNFDTSNVTDMRNMFAFSQIESLDLSNFDTSNVKNMRYLFRNSSNLKTVYAGNKFSTASVTDSSDMFLGTTKLVGGSGTTYNSSNVDKTYARIDGGEDSPGYFTEK